MVRGGTHHGKLDARPSGGLIMKLTRALLLTIPFGTLAATFAPDAAACGGCFVPPLESTLVTGHRMILSISQQETTLWDQIEYTGEPTSFAWVLPIKGIV